VNFEDAMKIDFVSDIACPWCAVGLNSLEIALSRLEGTVSAQLQFQPFELNPSLPPDGEDVIEHLSRKYGASPEQLAASRKVLHERGAAVGFRFGDRVRVWNTFDAHRLLHWAGIQGRQRELKHALLRAYHTQGENPGATDVLLRCVVEAGLDPEQARDVLGSGRYADEVRQREAYYQQLGIQSVPSVVIDDQHLIQGGQPPEVFEQALRQIANGAST
jgi:predicted DsbA family dithiol-disulfide isomerase